jgi:rRNA maturation endonuclease Nob1
MSLINQALHKAQRDRTPKRMPQIGEPSASTHTNPSDSGMNRKLVIGLVIAVAVLVGLVVGLSVTIFQKDNSSEPQQLAQSPTNHNRPSVTEPEINTTSTDTTDKLSSHALKTQTSTASTASPQELAPQNTVVDELRKARQAAEAEAALQAKLASEKAEKEALAAQKAAAKPSEDIITWLAHAKLSGVRMSKTDSKVILNGKAYSTGEFVNFKLGLKVMAIQKERVLFVDGNGKKYMKRL